VTVEELLIKSGLVDSDSGRISISALNPGGLWDSILRSAPGSARKLAKQSAETERRIGVVLRGKAAESAQWGVTWK
jgi:hypothetical protein